MAVSVVTESCNCSPVEVTRVQLPETACQRPSAPQVLAGAPVNPELQVALQTLPGATLSQPAGQPARRQADSQAGASVKHKACLAGTG